MQDVDTIIQKVMLQLQEPFGRNFDQRLTPELAQGLFTTIERAVRKSVTETQNAAS